MFIRIALAATTLLMSSSALTAQTTDLFEAPPARQLEGQDIDANTRLLEALTKAAKKGPRFRVSPDKIFMTLERGDVGAETVRVSNDGDEKGAIQGINALGAINGLDVSDNCPEGLTPGAFCDIAIRYESSAAGNVQSVVIATIEERGRSSLDIPLNITVNEVVVEEEPEEEEATNEPLVVHVPKIEEPKGPSSRDVAASYMSRMRGVGSFASRPGFVIVSRPDGLMPKQFVGVPHSDIRTEVEYSDQRYSKDVPSTQASLPVNRDHILTSDRVIKAVLDTPVSNIMCGKVVAMVESDVYSATGSEPLIPAGSRVIGSCGSFADERVGIAWSRIITTDGRSIEFDDGATGTNDASGLGGGLGRVYRSNFDRFVLPIISTVVETASGLIFANFGEDETVVVREDGSTVESNSARNEGLRIITDNARNQTQELIAEIRDVREIMVLPSGSRIDIEVSEDIYFKDRREVVRVADTRYVVDNVDEQKAEEAPGDDLVLVPYRAGMNGPRVTLEGRDYVIQKKPPVLDKNGEPVVRTETVSELLEEDEE